MPLQSCLSMRPGTIFGYQGQAWKVSSNDTLDCSFSARTIDGPRLTKRFRYIPGQEIQVRWVPQNNR